MGGPSATAPLTSQRMALHGVQLVSGEKTAKQFVGVWRTVQLHAIMVPARMKTAPAILWSRVAVGTAALQSDPAGLEKVTATATLTVDTDSSVGTVTVHSSDLTTMPGQTAVTTLNIPTTEKPPAGTTVASMRMGRLSRQRIGATTVFVSPERLSALKRSAMEVMTKGATLWVEQILEANVFSRSHLMAFVTPIAPKRSHMMARHGAPLRPTTRGTTSEVRGTGAIALTKVVVMEVVEVGGAHGGHGAPVQQPVEEVRGVV